MISLVKDFKTDITELFKAYKMAHFSLYNMQQTFYNFKADNPEIENFVIEDRDFESSLRFNKYEIEKNSEDGLYQKIIAGNTISMFYNIWEDKYRGLIAKNFNVKKNDIKNTLFWELNLIRQCITHNNYNPVSDLKKLNLLNFIGDSNSLKLSSHEVQKLYDLIMTEITKLSLM